MYQQDRPTKSCNVQLGTWSTQVAIQKWKAPGRLGSGTYVQKALAWLEITKTLNRTHSQLLSAQPLRRLACTSRFTVLLLDGLAFIRRIDYNPARASAR